MDNLTQSLLLRPAVQIGGSLIPGENAALWITHQDRIVSKVDECNLLFLFTYSVALICLITYCSHDMEFLANEKGAQTDVNRKFATILAQAHQIQPGAHWP